MCAFHRTELIFYETGYLDDNESNLKFNVNVSCMDMQIMWKIVQP